MPKVVLNDEALRDYDESLEWYLKRSQSAALGFERAVRIGLDKILAHPDRWPKCDEMHRFHNLKRYPFSIIYRMRGEDVEVTAIAHASRRPNYWKP